MSIDHPPEGRRRVTPDEAYAAPVWFELLAVSGTALLAPVGLVGLTLAILGAYSTPLALLLGAPVGLVAVFMVRRAIEPVDSPRRAHAGAVAALAIAGLFLVVAARAPSQHVLINRDPGSYTTTARWLAQEGSLEVHAATGGLSAGGPLSFDSYAVYDVGEGVLQFQFNHLTSVALAVADDLGGQRLLFRLPALAASSGLLALYAVAVRMTGRPLASLVAPAVVGASLPFLFVARDTFSEPFTMALLWSAVLVGVIAVRSRHVAAAAVAGLLLGATVATRIDSMLVVAIAFPLLAVFVANPGGEQLGARIRVAGAAVGAMLPGVAIGMIDLEYRSGGYAARHSDQAWSLRVMAVASLVISAVAALVVIRRPGVLERPRAAGRRVALPAAVGVVGTFVFAWFVRPRVQVMRGVDEAPLVGALQSGAGVTVDPARRYGEMSLEWMSWYLGPLGLAVGLVGLGFLVHRSLRGRANAAGVAVAALLLVTGAIYWWRPSIVPDHPWAMRRFVPAVLPGLALTMAAAVATMAELPRVRPAARQVLSVVAAGVLVTGPALVTWPVRELREQHGYADVLEQGCELIGPDASVVVVGDPATNILPQSIRAWCGVPVATLGDAPSSEQIERLRARVEAAGRSLAWVAMDEEAVSLHGSGPVLRTGVAVEERRVERTLLRAPRRYVPPGTGSSLFVRREAP